ncbi:MAG: thymidylate synthase [Candidatus Sungbacteria bacterium RIFCSPLOWO2_02_FULL_54_10]|uniref:Thymidylate synthase n=2 Tax=Candidatus Sungiibacteriota TaxID=1817917 RepID=A0A1G2L8Z5_9BACT|nr:MAG: thymidylate synthase [Candidatus Sungbacteria bacterium RIFCSPHIGHO2_01_FULL_54_26]OHA03982.1 MAG: thymidylate synthase [Candidatus Sungbacteria bacterium RIFCSPHIGHO2_02_FULL_53_17]OHA08097.1 MAG: thymidylate synthase [Candidatus Sungbacteria bacterium RIFCSPLOWO2_01_FULL_54_21]OHA12850.1 MAG: thymidylate synthase [Candidatus Sungbacteria bacterium RIFCSPLOWO2_02_FULL_54_10]
MRQYLDLVAHILANGAQKTDPQKVGNIAVCGYQMRFDLDDGFPLITTRSMKGSWKAMVHELLWILSGSTKIADLNKNNVHLWDIWATPEICAPLGLEAGDLGPIYGKQWRAFDGGGEKPVDQIQKVVDDLKHNPDSRRLVVSAWNPVDVEKVFVAPCHCFFKFFHAQGELSLHVFQRSADVPVGVPFDIAEYALLLMMMAQVTDLKPKDLIYTLSDTHIYLNQIEPIKELLNRDPRPLPNVTLNPAVKNIFDFTFEDFSLTDYDPHPPFKIPVAL